MTGNPPTLTDAMGNRLPSASFLQHPAALLALLGAVSGAVSTLIPGRGLDGLPSGFGLFMVLAGVWFGLVIGFGMWRFAAINVAACVAVAAVTWLAWEAAVNLAMQVTEYSLKISALPETPRQYLAGFLAGAVGALLTWAGAAYWSPALRQRAAAAGVGAVGAALGLLLPLSMSIDYPALLFVPWQVGVAGMLGHFLARQQPALGS